MMMKLPIDKEANRFKEHLELKENQRIILSGIFGIGKSYFIQRFFKEHEEDYILFKLNPVNYTVSGNDDILELIKFDIAYQMMSSGVDFKKLEIDASKFSQYYFLKNPKEVLKVLLSNVRKVNGVIDAVYSAIQDLTETIQEQKEKLEKDEKDKLQRFIRTFYTESQGIREEDDITVLINTLLRTLKEEHPEKKLVLAIDDLDRIDPEHIFRILNVFSAHFDFHEGANKFNFDKVVLICDIENIRGIFQHRYGTNIDFTGYIDKFYSTEIFHYNFREVLMEHISAILPKIRTNHLELHKSLEYSGESTYYSKELSRIFTDFIQMNLINTRSIVNLLRYEFSPPSFTIGVGEKGYSKPINTNISLLVVFDILEKIVGDSAGLADALYKASERMSFLRLTLWDHWWDRTIGTAVMLINAKTNQFTPNITHKFDNQELDLQIIYKVQLSNNGYGFYGEIFSLGSFNAELNKDIEDISNPKKDFQEDRIPYYQLLLQAYQAYQKFLPKR